MNERHGIRNIITSEPIQVCDRRGDEPFLYVDTFRQPAFFLNSSSPLVGDMCKSDTHHITREVFDGDQVVKEV